MDNMHIESYYSGEMNMKREDNTIKTLTRRNFLKTTGRFAGCVMALSAFGPLASVAKARRRQKRPNILLVVVDDIFPAHRLGGVHRACCKDAQRDQQCRVPEGKRFHPDSSFSVDLSCRHRGPACFADTGS